MATKYQATEEQLIYASILDKGMKLGLLAIVVTFTLYASGVMTPHVPIGDLPKYWSMPVKDYLAATSIHTGWSWLGMLGKGDFVNFIGIALLAGVTIACYIAIMPVFLKKKDKVFFIISLIEVVVLLVASSGILKGGGH